MGYNPSDFKGDNIPVNNVSYIQIEEFIAKLTELTSEHCSYHLSYRLMTEREYQHAAGEYVNVFGDSSTIINAGLSTSFGGVSIWCAENSANRPHEVALTPPNEHHGLYDMYGNLWEICAQSKFYEGESIPAPQRNDYDDELAYKRADLKWRLLGGHSGDFRTEILLKGGAWNMPKESCVKETFLELEIEENDKFANAGFRLMVNILK